MNLEPWRVNYIKVVQFSQSEAPFVTNYSYSFSMAVLMVQYLLHDPIDLAILGVDLLAHVQGHVTQIANDTSHLLQVLIHLILPGVICYPGMQRRI